MKLRSWLKLALIASGMTSASLMAASPFDGFYAGISGGILESIANLSSAANAKYTGIFDFPSSPNFIGNGGEDDRQQNFSGIGSIALGYGQTLGTSPFYLGAEISGNYGKREINSQDRASHLSGEGLEPTVSLITDKEARLRSGEFDIDLRPGFFLTNDFLLYGRVGAAFNKEETFADNTFIINDSSLGGTVTRVSFLNIGDDRNVTGLRLGAGGEVCLGNNWSLTGDYIFTDYGKSKSFVGTAPTVSPFAEGGRVANVVIANGLSSSIDSDFYTQTVMIGLKYYFMPHRLG